MNWVHVAVAAEAHVRATFTAAAGGQRIIVRSGPFFYQDLRKLHIHFVPSTSEPDSCDLQNKLMRQWSSVSRMCRVESQV